MCIIKEGEWNIVLLLEELDLISRVAHPDADQLDLIACSIISLYYLIEFVGSWSMPLAVRAVHVEYFDDNNVCIDICKGDLAAILFDSQVGAGIRIIRYGKLHLFYYFTEVVNCA